MWRLGYHGISGAKNHGMEEDIVNDKRREWLMLHWEPLLEALVYMLLVMLALPYLAQLSLGKTRGTYQLIYLIDLYAVNTLLSLVGGFIFTRRGVPAYLMPLIPALAFFPARFVLYQQDMMYWLMMLVYCALTLPGVALDVMLKKRKR